MQRIRTQINTGPFILSTSNDVTAETSGRRHRQDPNQGHLATAVPDYEGSDDYEDTPLLFYRMDWEHRYFEFAAGQFKANLLNGPSLEFGPVVKFRRNAWADADDNQVKRLRGDGDAIEVGPFVAVKLGKEEPEQLLAAQSSVRIVASMKVWRMASSSSMSCSRCANKLRNIAERVDTRVRTTIWPR